MSARIDILHYALQQVPGPQAFFQAHFDEWFTFAFYAFLIRSEGRNVLLDCGMDDSEPLNALCRASLGDRGVVRPNNRESRITELLDRHGLRPEDIDVVAFSHFHIDHIANARLFSRARFLVSDEGWSRHMATRQSFPQMTPDPAFPAAVIDFLVEVKEERVDLVRDGPTSVPGLSVRYVGGHTLDSAAFVAETDEGSVVFPGDTISARRNLEDDHPVGSAVDIAQCYRAMAWARSAGEVILPSHEPDLLQRHRGGRIG